MIRRGMVCLIFLVITPVAWAASASPFQVYYVAVGSTDYLQPEKADVHGFSKLYGANACARTIASLLEQGGSVYGQTLTSTADAFVTVEDVKQALDQVKSRIDTAHPSNPLLVFYLMSHGLSEGIAWNHFCIPGNLVFQGNAADLTINDLMGHALATGDIVDQLKKWHIPFIAFIDTCSDGHEQSFASSVLSPSATQSLNGVSQALKFMNEFHDTGPVLFACPPGTSVLSVKNPLNSQANNVGPIGRRIMLVLAEALKEKRALSLESFFQSLQSPTLDTLTAPRSRIHLR